MKEVRVQFPFENGHELSEVMAKVLEYDGHPRSTMWSIAHILGLRYDVLVGYLG